MVYTQKQIKFDSDHDGCTGTIVHYISAIYGVWGLTTFVDEGVQNQNSYAIIEQDLNQVR